MDKKDQEKKIKERMSNYLSKLRAGREKNSFWLSLGLNPGKMGRLENQQERPSLMRLIHICKKFNLSANWILLGIGPEMLSSLKPPIASFNGKDKETNL